jgi:ParB family chromosome partitioning protein
VSGKRGLDKSGLDSMFEPLKKVVREKQSGETVVEVAVKNLLPNPFQPRHTFDEKALGDLTESIRQSGVLQPLIVRKKGRAYEIVAGERRWRAAKAAGLNKVPVVIRNYDDPMMMEVALIENMQRSDLDPLEEARGIKAMMDALGLTQDAAARRLGMSRTSLANLLRLLNLPAKAAELVSARRLTMGQVRPLLGLNKAEQIEKLASRAAEEGWSARMMEEYVAGEKSGLKQKELLEQLNQKREENKEGKKAKEKAKKAIRQSQNVYVKAFQEELTEFLGTKVRIQPDKKENGGRIVIEYYSDEDLDRVLELLKDNSNEKKNRSSRSFTV